MSEPKYDEDIVNLGYLNKVINNETSKSGQTISKHYASKPNTPYYAGDTWIDGNILYTCINTRLIGLYNDSDWVTESGAKQEAERKNKTFLTQPSNYNVGDMWILQSDTDHRAGKKGEILITTAGRKEYDAYDWINMLDYGTIRSINEVANNINDALERLKLSKDNGIVTIFYSNTIPNEMIIGDLWFVIETIDTYTKNNLYKYDGTSWQIITDNLSVVAFEEANQARLVEDGKIQSFYDVEMPDTGMSVGDIWINTDNKKLYRYNGTNWVPVYDTRINEIRKSVESVSETMVEISTDLGQIKQTVANHTETITKLGSTETAEGTELNIDASKNPAHIKIWGKTEQATRSGKNLLPYPYIYTTTTINEITFTDNGDGTITANGTATENTIYVLINQNSKDSNTFRSKILNKKISLSGCPNGGSSSTYRLQIWNINNSGNFIYDYGSGGTNTFTNESNNYNVCIYVFKGAKLNNVVFKPMVEISDNITDYEPYGASPSPDYPSRIRNIGDNINLYNKETMPLTKGLWIGSSNIIASNPAGYYVIVPIIGGFTYTISKKYNNKDGTGIGLYYCTTAVNPANGVQAVDNWDGNSSYTKLTINTNVKAKYLFLGLLGANTITDELKQKAIEELKIEKGPIATPYTDYGCGSIDYRIENGGNIFDTSKAIVCSIGNWWTTIIPNKTNNTSVTIDENYYLHGTASTYLVVVAPLRFIKDRTIYNKGAFGLIIYNNNGKAVGVPDSTSYTPTETFDGYIGVRINTGAATEGKKILLMYHDIATSFPYKEQTIHFPLSEGQLLHEGDYLAKDGIHQKRKTIVLDGTENITHINGNDKHKLVSLSISDNVINDVSKSSHFINKTLDEIWNSETINGIAIKNNTIYINFVFSQIPSATSISAIKTWLAEQYANGTPVIVEYELAEEVVIPLTPAQQKVIDNIETFKGQNYISCIDEIVPEKIEMEYYPNTPFNDTLVNKDTFDKVTSDMSAQINIKTNEVETSVKESTTASILTLLNNGYLTAEQVNALVNGNAEDIAVVKEQLKQTITSSQMQIEITKALEGGVSYLKNTLFTIDDKGMAIATNQDEFNALYNNKGMYLYSFEQLIAKFDVNGATLNNLKILGEVETENLRMMNVSVSGVAHTHIHWIGG